MHVIDLHVIGWKMHGFTLINNMLPAEWHCYSRHCHRAAWCLNNTTCHAKKPILGALALFKLKTLFSVFA